MATVMATGTARASERRDNQHRPCRRNRARCISPVRCSGPYLALRMNPSSSGEPSPARGDRLVRSLRSRLRNRTWRSCSVSPPQMPYGSRTDSACLRHCSRTGQRMQITFARDSRAALAAPRSLSGWKKTALVTPRHAPRNCQSQRSTVGPGSLRVSVTSDSLLDSRAPGVRPGQVPGTGGTGAVHRLEPRQALFKRW